MYIITKYKGKWSVMDTKTKVFYFIGLGKKYCEKRCFELNNSLTT